MWSPLYFVAFFSQICLSYTLVPILFLETISLNSVYKSVNLRKIVEILTLVNAPLHPSTDVLLSNSTVWPRLLFTLYGCPNGCPTACVWRNPGNRSVSAGKFRLQGGAQPPVRIACWRVPAWLKPKWLILDSTVAWQCNNMWIISLAQFAFLKYSM